MKRQSRETAFKVIYQIDMGKNDMETALQITMDNDGLNQKEQLFCRQLVLAVEEQLDEIDRMIQRNTTGWTIDRMMSVDRNLLRLAVYDIVYGGHITPEGAINEAVELAKVYGQKRSSAFINSILDIHRQLGNFYAVLHKDIQSNLYFLLVNFYLDPFGQILLSQFFRQAGSHTA